MMPRVKPSQNRGLHLTTPSEAYIFSGTVFHIVSLGLLNIYEFFCDLPIAPHSSAYQLGLKSAKPSQNQHVSNLHPLLPLPQ